MIQKEYAPDCPAEKSVRPVAKESLAELLWETVCGWLLAVGVALLLNVEFTYPLGIPTLLWQTGVCALAAMVLTRRWFLPLAAVGAALLAGLVGLLLAKIPLAEAWQQGVAFAAWWLENLPQSSPLFTPENMRLVHILVNVGAAFLLFAAVRLCRRALIPLLLCLSTLVLVVVFGNSQADVLAIAAFLAGGFPLIARDKYVGRRAFSRRDRYALLGRRWVVPTVAGVLCIAAAAGMLWLLPQDTSQMRTRRCSQWTADVQAATGLYLSAQKEADAVTLRTLGLQPRRTHIGGNRKSPDSAVLAITDAPAGLLMRVTSFDTYDGKLWTNQFSTAYRLDGPARQKQIDFLGSPALKSEIWKAELDAVAQRGKIHVTMAQGSNFLGTIGQTAGLTEQTATKNPLMFNDNGEVLTFFAMPAGYEYTLKAAVFWAAALDEDSIVKLLAIGSAAKNDPILDNAEQLARYTQLPKGYSANATEIAARCAADCDTTLEQAARLCRLFSLSAGFRYTDRPGYFGVGDNVVDQLLEQKAGYSVYYATAMATMARSLGIPSRLAAGYRLVQQGDHTVADTAQAYAWVECYFRGIGWLSYDPNPAANMLAERRIRLIQKQQQESDEPEDTPETEKPKEPEKPAEPEKPEEPEILEGRTLVIQLKWLLAALGGLVLMFVLLRGAFSAVLQRPGVIRLRYPAASCRAEYYYQDILRQLAALGCPLRTGDTLTACLERAEPVLGAAQTDRLRLALRPVMALHYGDHLPTAEQADTIAAAHAMLEKAVWQRLGWLRYFVCRRVLLRRHFRAVRRIRSK